VFSVKVPIDIHTLKVGGHPFTDKPNRNYGQQNGIYKWNQLIRKDYWGPGIFLYMVKHNDTPHNGDTQNNELNHFYGTYIQFFT